MSKTVSTDVSNFYLRNPGSLKRSLEYQNEYQIPYPTTNGERTHAEALFITHPLHTAVLGGN